MGAISRRLFALLLLGSIALGWILGWVALGIVVARVAGWDSSDRSRWGKGWSPVPNPVSPLPSLLDPVPTEPLSRDWAGIGCEVSFRA
jgi:hypothetical protein